MSALQVCGLAQLTYCMAWLVSTMLSYASYFPRHFQSAEVVIFAAQACTRHCHTPLHKS